MEDHEVIPFKVGHQVWCSNRGLVAVVSKVTEKYISVKYLKDGSFERFHFNPSHHMHSNITQIQHYNP